MARYVRCLALMAALGWFGAWVTTGPVRTAPAPARVVVVPAPTTVVAAPTTTTTEAPQRPVRASRGVRRTVVAQTPVSPRGDCSAWGWVRTRAESDACWRESVSRWTDWDVDRMLRILYCESRGDPWAKNRHSGAAGLLQVIGASQGDGPANIELGHSVWLRGGYSRWTCR